MVTTAYSMYGNFGIEYMNCLRIILHGRQLAGSSTLSAMHLLCQIYALLSIRESCVTRPKLVELLAHALVQINIPSYANTYVQC